MTAWEALHQLKQGNQTYLSAETSGGNISPAIRTSTCMNGQKPYAVIITCSDSRVIPESIFSAGIGELFVIRVAGNVMDKHQLGSVEYAVHHLHTRLVVVLGHTHCGAVDAALHECPSGYIRYITDEILRAVGEEKDPERACLLNVRHSVRTIETALHFTPESGVNVCGAIYHIEDGTVGFLDA